MTRVVGSVTGSSPVEHLHYWPNELVKKSTVLLPESLSAGSPALRPVAQQPLRDERLWPETQPSFYNKKAGFSCCLTSSR